MLSDRQAEDIVLLDLRGVASFTDHFVIATATSVRQMDALADAVHDALAKEGVKPRKREGTPNSGWVLVDYGDVIVHLFAPEEREYYKLDRLWSAGVPLVRIQ